MAARSKSAGEGPLWLIYDPPGERPALREESETWPWGVFYIRCGLAHFHRSERVFSRSPENSRNTT